MHLCVHYSSANTHVSPTKATAAAIRLDFKPSADPSLGVVVAFPADDVVVLATVVEAAVDEALAVVVISGLPSVVITPVVLVVAAAVVADEAALVMLSATEEDDSGLGAVEPQSSAMNPVTSSAVSVPGQAATTFVVIVGMISFWAQMHAMSVWSQDVPERAVRSGGKAQGGTVERVSSYLAKFLKVLTVVQGLLWQSECECGKQCSYVSHSHLDVKSVSTLRY